MMTHFIKTHMYFFLFEYLNYSLNSTVLKCKFHHFSCALMFLKCACSIDSLQYRQGEYVQVYV